MKNNHFPESDISDKIRATLATEYKKQNVSVAFGSFTTPKFLVIGFEFEVSGELCKAIICNGKSRLAERRRAIKALLLALRYGYLQEMKIGRRKLRGAFIFSKDAEVMND